MLLVKKLDVAGRRGDPYCTPAEPQIACRRSYRRTLKRWGIDVQLVES